MSIRNLEGKLQETLSSMQEVGNLVGEAESLMTNTKDTAASKSMIVQLKQNILNQTEQKISETQSQLDNPPMTISFKDFKVQFVVDEDALAKINAQLASLNSQAGMHEFLLDDARGDVEQSHQEASAHGEIKDMLETEMETLNTQASGIVDAIRSERASNLDAENLKKDKPALDSKESNKQKDGYKGFSSYVNDNQHVVDFEKVQDGQSSTETHIDGVD